MNPIIQIGCAGSAAAAAVDGGGDQSSVLQQNLSSKIETGHN